MLFEVSGKVARHAWRRQPPGADELAFETLPDRIAPRPGERLEQRAQLRALSTAIAGCRADHDGLLEAARRFGDVAPE